MRFLTDIIDKYLGRYCKRKPVQTENDFYNWCRLGHLDEIKNILEHSDLKVNLNTGLDIACDNNFSELGAYLISKGATNIDDCLKKACQRFKYDFVEMLVKNGGNISVGLRYSKSANITRMLYRYEQKSELINN